MQRTQVKVVAERGNWVKVNVEGWIYKPSVTADQTSILRRSHSRPQDETAIGNGFFYRNLSFSDPQFGNGYRCIGEIVNRSGKNYQLANFGLSVYDEDGRILGTAYINISNIQGGSVKSFESGDYRISLSAVSRYVIRFENGF